MKKQFSVVQSLLTYFLVFTILSLPNMVHARRDKDHNNPPPRFTENDRRVVRDYYEVQRRNMPPGLAKKNSLPPGLQKKIQREGRLPPGLEKRRLPDDLAAQMGSLPPRYERVIIGHDVVILDKKTQLILDVIKLIVP